MRCLGPSFGDARSRAIWSKLKNASSCGLVKFLSWCRFPPKFSNFNDVGDDGNLRSMQEVAE